MEKMQNIPNSNEVVVKAIEAREQFATILTIQNAVLPSDQKVGLIKVIGNYIHYFFKQYLYKINWFDPSGELVVSLLYEAGACNYDTIRYYLTIMHIIINTFILQVMVVSSGSDNSNCWDYCLKPTFVSQGKLSTDMMNILDCSYKSLNITYTEKYVWTLKREMHINFHELIMMMILTNRLCTTANSFVVMNKNIFLIVIALVIKKILYDDNKVGYSVKMFGLSNKELTHAEVTYVWTSNVNVSVDEFDKAYDSIGSGHSVFEMIGK